MKRQGQALSLKNLTKSNVWDIQENDVFRLWAQAERDADLRDNERHYIDVIKSAFTIEEVKVDKPEVIKKYEERGWQVGQVRLDEGTTVKWALKKKSIQRITDLTWENIHHISAQKLIEVLERNFGGGWESLPQSVQDIILSGFDISTTTLPTARLKKPGGLYEKKVADGFEDEDEMMPEEERGTDDEDDEDFDEDKLTEESYRTTFDTNPEDLEMQADEVGEDVDF